MSMFRRFTFGRSDSKSKSLDEKDEINHEVSTVQEEEEEEEDQVPEDEILDTTPKATAREDQCNMDSLEDEEQEAEDEASDDDDDDDAGLKITVKPHRTRSLPASPSTGRKEPEFEPATPTSPELNSQDVYVDDRCQTITDDRVKKLRASRHKRSISDVLPQFTNLHDSEGEDEQDELEQYRKEGVVAKWTNYIHGWQNRYLVLRSGVLSYFKSASEKNKVCRGTIDLARAKIRAHEFDGLRFDVSVSDQAYYLRCSSEKERQSWIEVLKAAQARFSSTLSRRDSTLSLTSLASMQSTQSGSLAAGRNYGEKFGEVCTSHDVLMRQIAGFQSSIQNDDDLNEIEHNLFTFKATSQQMMTLLGQCIDMMARREEEWQRKYERANDRRKRLEATLRQMKATPQHNPYGNPDYEEGPHSALNEEEFFDALETGLDQLEAEREAEQNERERALQYCNPDSHHQYTELVNETISNSLKLAEESLDGNWVLAHEEGPMKVFRREVASDGTISDRLKAHHEIQGISARELCTYFFDVAYREEWEHTVEKFLVLENPDENTVVVHNIHKRVWPAAQRDSCIISHIRQLGPNVWAVQNLSIDHPAAKDDRMVRIQLNVLLLVETILPEEGTTPTRDNISVKVTYLAYLNPGGWAPPSVVRAVSKREYPKFLRNLEQCSKKSLSKKPLTL